MTHGASMSLLRWLLPLVLLAHAAPCAADDLVDAALAADSACEGKDDTCALSMLQRRGEMVIHDVEVPAPEEDLIEPASEGYPLGVALGDLGLDELARLAADAREELARRGNTSDAEDAAALGEEASLGESATGLGCPFHAYSGRRSGKELCFCQLAGNPGCSGMPCACPQGCSAALHRSGSNVVFANRARAHGCSPSTVLLTSPKAYFSTTSDLKRSCGGGAVSVVRSLLTESWNAYQSRVGRGSVNQCFHSSRVASVKYLHLQTFCGGGNFHGFPTSNPSLGFCVKMHSLGQASSLAAQLVAKMH